jgi:stage V sporulation protein G
MEDFSMANLEINKTNKDSGEIMGTVSLDVRAYAIAEPKGKVKGYANVNIDGMFAVNGISIVEGKNGLFVSMPQVKDSKGEFRDVAHPVTAEGREALNKAVLSEFSVALDAMVVAKESTVQKMREAAAAAKVQSSPAAGKEPKGKKKSEPEL